MTRSLAKRLLILGGLAGLNSHCGGEGADPNGPSNIVAPLQLSGATVPFEVTGGDGTRSGASAKTGVHGRVATSLVARRSPAWHIAGVPVAPASWAMEPPPTASIPSPCRVGWRSRTLWSARCTHAALQPRVRPIGWGGNASGQLGDGTTIMRLTPFPVAGGLALRNLTAGGASTCGLTQTGGAAYCWGANASGQLGDGSFTLRRTPVPVIGGLTFESLDGRGNTVCGVDGRGSTYCWGENSGGESGNGTQTDSSLPVAATGGLGFNAVTVGRAGSCGLTASGTAYCWGPNGYGQVGDGTKTKRVAPTAVQF